MCVPEDDILEQVKYRSVGRYVEVVGERLVKYGLHKLEGGKNVGQDILLFYHWRDPGAIQLQ